MPWGLSHKYRFIFIHIPKTAGTTICSSWEGALLKEVCRKTGILGGTHKSAMQLQRAYPHEWKHYFKFAVVRNPYDRFVSKFYFKQLHPRTNFDLEWNDKEVEGILPQLYWITNRQNYFLPTSSYDRRDLHFGKIIVDRVLRYENLEAELREVFNLLKLDIPEKVFPHFRQTRMEGGYKQYFDEKLRSLVKYLYREDLQRFNYAWED